MATKEFTGNPVSYEEVESFLYYRPQALAEETQRTVLREAETRYRNELLPDEERMHLQDRIGRLRRQLKLAQA
jgi:hypothetical protein